MKEIDKVNSVNDAINWFEMELINGKCKEDCPQCTAYEYAITALKKTSDKNKILDIINLNTLMLKANSIACLLSHKPDIFPTACDSIQLEYEKSTGEYLEFELFLDDTLKVFQVDANGNESTCYIDQDIEKINSLINEFYKERE